MKLMNGVFALAVAALLAGCTGNSPVQKLNRSQPVGSPYTKYLALYYRSLANDLQGRFINDFDALHFAKKGLASVDGVIVMPEVVEDWSLGPSDITEMNIARAELVTALENGGREIAPDKSAIAQSRFDCWVALQELASGENSCKAQFRAAMTELSSVLTSYNAPLPASVTEAFPSPVTDAPMGEMASLHEAAFMVFFDWDRYVITGNGNNVLDVVASEIGTRKDVQRAVVTGHTDTSGSEKYNKSLSLKRAKAVRDALIRRGLAGDKIRIEGRGESDLLVKTPDNVRQPENRRAQITLE